MSHYSNETNQSITTHLIMNILRTAFKFEKKIAIAAVNVLQNIMQIRQTAKNILTFRNAFMQASDHEVYTKATLDSLDTNSRMYYISAKDYGLSESTHAKYLSILIEDVEELEQLKGNITSKSQFDELIIPKLNILKNMLHNTVPVAIAAPPKPAAVSENKPASYNKEVVEQAPKTSKPPADVIPETIPFTFPETPAHKEYLESLERARELANKPIPRPERLPYEDAPEFNSTRKDWDLGNWSYKPY